MKTKKMLVLLLVLSITVSAVSGCGKPKRVDVTSDVGDINLTWTPLVTKQAESAYILRTHFDRKYQCEDQGVQNYGK